MDKDIPMMPITVHEYSEARWERTLKRVLIAFVAVIFILAGLCGYLIYDRSLYDYQTVTVDGQDGGVANYMGAHASGDINNAENSSKDTKAQESEESETHSNESGD